MNIFAKQCSLRFLVLFQPISSNVSKKMFFARLKCTRNILKQYTETKHYNKPKPFSNGHIINTYLIEISKKIFFKE